jgi:hypothetical protein
MLLALASFAVLKGREWVRGGDLAESVWIFYIVYELLDLHNSKAVIHNSPLCKQRAYQKMSLNMFVLEGLIIVSYSGVNNTE